MPRRDSDRNPLIRALLDEPLGQLVALPIVALETSARFLRERTVLAALLSGGGLSIAISARYGWISPPEGLSSEGLIVAGVLGVMATLWLLEVIPVAATALLPLVLFPLLGVAPAKQVALAWGDSTILLLMSAFMLARGLERWGVPAVVAGLIERWSGESPGRLMFGLMAATSVLSAWMSNTAAALVMTTVAMTAVRRAEQGEPDRPKEVRRFTLSLLLGIGFSATIGGMATPIASPPNLVLLGLAGDAAPSFLQWMAFTIPLILLALPLMAWLLSRVVCRFDPHLKLAPGAGASLGALGPGGWRAIAVFTAVVLLWLTRADLELGPVRIPGWSSLLGLKGLVDDTTVAVAGALLMFMTPSGMLSSAVREASANAEDERPMLARALELFSRDRLLVWESARELPWHLILLFGGGLALAGAFESTGLGAWLGSQIGTFEGLPVWALVVAVTVGVSLLTEVTSSTATASVLLPVVSVAAGSLGLPVMQLMWPAALATSAAFLFPISTPPNAIVAGAGNVSFTEMARAGVLVKLVVVTLVALASLFWMPVVLQTR